MASAKGGRPRGGIPNPKVVEREQEVVKLRRQGMTWDMIGNQLGIHLTSARAAYERALKRVILDDVEEIRRIETERLDIAQSAIWHNVLQGDNPSIASLIRIMERRARLLGLDQPTRIQAEVITYDPTDIRAELARIVANANPVATNSSPTLSLGEPESPTNPAATGN